MLEEKDKHAIAIHEAAHFVLAIVGYNSLAGGKTYEQKPLKEIPSRITIKGKRNFEGYCNVPCRNELKDILRAPVRRRGWHILGLLAGYAAESAYGLSAYYSDSQNVKDDFDACRGDYAYPHDLCKVAFLLTKIFINHDVFDEHYDTTVSELWDQTTAIIKTPIVKEAIYHIAQLLEEKKTLTKREIFELKNQNLNVPGIEQYIMPVPTLQYNYFEA